MPARSLFVAGSAEAGEVEHDGKTLRVWKLNQGKGKTCLTTDPSLTKPGDYSAFFFKAMGLDGGETWFARNADKSAGGGNRSRVDRGASGQQSGGGDDKDARITIQSCLKVAVLLPTVKDTATLKAVSADLFNWVMGGGYLRKPEAAAPAQERRAERPHREPEPEPAFEDEPPF